MRKSFVFWQNVLFVISVLAIPVAMTIVVTPTPEQLQQKAEQRYREMARYEYSEWNIFNRTPNDSTILQPLEPDFSSFGPSSVMPERFGCPGRPWLPRQKMINNDVLRLYRRKDIPLLDFRPLDMGGKSKEDLLIATVIRHLEPLSPQPDKWSDPPEK